MKKREKKGHTEFQRPETETNQGIKVGVRIILAVALHQVQR